MFRFRRSVQGRERTICRRVVHGSLNKKMLCMRIRKRERFGALSVLLLSEFVSIPSEWIAIPCGWCLSIGRKAVASEIRESCAVELSSCY